MRIKDTKGKMVKLFVALGGGRKSSKQLTTKPHIGRRLLRQRKVLVSKTCPKTPLKSEGQTKRWRHNRTTLFFKCPEHLSVTILGCRGWRIDTPARQRRKVHHLLSVPKMYVFDRRMFVRFFRRTTQHKKKREKDRKKQMSDTQGILP